MLALAAQGSVHEGDWLIAERQTAGRGRQGRAWSSPPGNLYASGLVELRAGDPPAPTLALVAAIAVIDALGVPGLTLKWPNDVLCSCESRSPADAHVRLIDRAPACAGAHGKLAGILLERQNDAVVIGVGVNLAHHPALPDRPSTSLAALGVAMTPDAAIEALSAQVVNWLGVWRSEGVPAIRTAWLDRAHPVGTPLTTTLPEGTRIDGSFEGLTAEGALQLRLPDGTSRVIHAGDVFLI